MLTLATNVAFILWCVSGVYSTTPNATSLLTTMDSNSTTIQPTTTPIPTAPARNKTDVEQQPKGGMTTKSVVILYTTCGWILLICACLWSSQHQCFCVKRPGCFQPVNLRNQLTWGHVSELAGVQKSSDILAEPHEWTEFMDQFRTV